MKHSTCLVAVMTLVCASGSAHAQSLFRTDTPKQPQSPSPATTQDKAPTDGQATAPAPASPTKEGGNPHAEPSSRTPREPGDADVRQLSAFSLVTMEPPPPREIMVHDLISIIINETSRQSSTSKLDTKSTTNTTGQITTIPDLAALLELQLRSGDSSPLVKAGMSASENWKGDGKYERNDRFTDRITATVIDVKPNGTIVLEARRTIGKDDEVQTVVVSGTCRREDVTNANTVLSSQLADLTILSETEGELREATKKGWITRVFEAVFNF